MGKILSGIFGTSSDFRANTGGQNFGRDIANAGMEYQKTMQGQQGLASSLNAQAQGSGPNLGQMLLNQATDRNIKQNAALIASSKGVNPAVAQRLAAQNAASMGQEAAAQAASMGAQQQMQAQQALGNLYGQMAGQSLQNKGLSMGALDSANKVNAGIEMANTQAQNQLMGGLMGGLGAFLAKNQGGYIPGPEIVKGDSIKNDVVPVMASAGEIVIPKSKAFDPAKAKAFIDQLMKQKQPKAEGSSDGYAKILQIRRQLAELEAKMGA